MQTFTYSRASDVASALRDHDAASAFVAGGTTLIDLMKLDVLAPERVVDINRLPLAAIEDTADGGLRVGALARNADVAHHERVAREYPVLSQALLAGASAQLRNMATTAGNLMQRTRCVYFRDVAMPCNKREPGSGCPAIGGYNRNLAILGTSDRCIATNPSDQNVALAALEAAVQVRGRDGERSIPIADFFVEPGDDPRRETVLQSGELITSVILAKPTENQRATYLKLRDRQSYEFALASAAVVVTMRDGTIERARFAMGGIGTKPWRVPEAETALEGARAERASFEKAAAIVLRDAKPQPDNAFKIELARRCLVHALETVTAEAAQEHS